MIGAYIEDGEVKYRLVRHDDGTEAPYDTDELRPVTTGAPSIAGPAGLDMASGPPAGHWDKGVAVERQSAKPHARPRVGAWIAWEPACGASIYDDHGLVVASVWEAPDGWRWLARRRRITGHLGR